MTERSGFVPDSRIRQGVPDSAGISGFDRAFRIRAGFPDSAGISGFDREFWMRPQGVSRRFRGRGKGLDMDEKLAVISGFSGAGKGTVVRRLLDAHEDYALSISMTTRQPRPGEADGREYFFVTNEAFEELIQKDGFLEHAGFTGSYYGTPRAFVEVNLRRGKNVLLEIEVQGAMQVRERLPQAVLIFVTPPDAGELERRLVGRGTETAEKVTKRLLRAVEEIEYIREYPFLVINDDCDACASAIHSLINCASAQVRDAAAGRVITDSEEKRAFAQRFRRELLEVLARRERP